MNSFARDVRRNLMQDPESYIEDRFLDELRKQALRKNVAPYNRMLLNKAADIIEWLLDREYYRKMKNHIVIKDDYKITRCR